jgi:hypothetical protein
MLEATVSKDSNSKHGDTDSFNRRVINLQRQMDGISHTESFEDHSSVYFTETKVGLSNIMRLSTMMSPDASPQ